MESNKESFIVSNRINEAIAEYKMVVKTFMLYKKKLLHINKILDEFDNYHPRKVSMLDHISESELRNAVEKEEVELNIEYNKYNEYLEKINFIIEEAIS